MHKIIQNKPGEKVIMLGNEALIRGAIESGVNFVSTYPGTPASDIGDTFYKTQNSPDKIKNLYFEYSTNEKVALEAAIGASFSGIRALVAMKNFGLNVASDTLPPFCYTGTNGATVIMVADDVSCWSSAESEQNTRPYSYMAHIPTLEPADPQETKDFTKLAYKISDKFKIPVMLRTTTRVVHQSAPVTLGKIQPNLRKAEFVKNNYQFSTMPPGVLQKKKELLEKIKKIQSFAEKSKINQTINFKPTEKYKTGLITSGVGHLYAMEAMKELGVNLPVLKLGFFYPLPEEKIKSFIKNFKKILVVEELEPFVEKEIRALAKEANCKLEILGKNVLPEVNELKTEILVPAICKLIGRKPPVCKEISCLVEIEKRYPKLCPGCPHWLTFNAVRKAAPNAAVGGDIGCYMIAGFPPNNIQDFLLSMGSSTGISHGIVKALQKGTNSSFAKASSDAKAVEDKSEGKQKVISFMGDGTFLHSGISSLLNTVFNKSNPLLIILDNGTTAMTGHQPNPGISKANSGENISRVKIEDIVAACGVKNLKVIDQANQAEFITTIKEFLNNDEVSVIIARHPCVLLKNNPWTKNNTI